MNLSTMNGMVLPDNALLEIFDFCRMNDDYTCHGVWKWHLLVHVCQKWRKVIFASPHRLNLQLLCTFGTPVRRNLDIWPPFPIAVEYFSYPERRLGHSDEDNVIAALQHPNRVRYINLYMTGLQLRKMATVMQEPFPVLKYLRISLGDHGYTPVLPADLLGGYMPCLQEMNLSGIPFSTFPTPLLSASDLVILSLRYIPSAGCISPSALVGILAALHKLECFILRFQSYELTIPRPGPSHTPPGARIVLPVLTSFEFRGPSKYLEDLVARIESPQLNQISIFYLEERLEFPIDQLAKFLSRSVDPHLALFNHAQVTFCIDKPVITFDMCPPPNDSFSCFPPARTSVSCEGFAWQALRLAKVLRQLSASLSDVVHLKIKTEAVGHSLRDSTDNIPWSYDPHWTYDDEWQNLLQQFPTAQTLYVSRELAGRVASALDWISEVMDAEFLPSLDLICFAGQPTSSIETFVAARQGSGRPVTAIDAEWEFERRLESYGSE